MVYPDAVIASRSGQLENWFQPGRMNLGGAKPPVANPFPRQSTTAQDIQRLTQARAGVPAPAAVAPVLPSAATIQPQVQTPNLLQPASGIQWYNPPGSGYAAPGTYGPGTPQMVADPMSGAGGMNSLAGLINMFKSSGFGK